MSSVIYAYLIDPAFNKRNTALPNYLKNNGGIGQISQVGLSYFLDVSVLSDSRDSTKRVVNIPHATNGSLLFDGEFDSDATTLLQSATQDVINSMFELTDLVFFGSHSSTSTADVEKSLLANSVIAKTYVTGSLKLPENQVTGNYYDDNGDTVSFTTWPYLICDLNIPVGTTVVAQTFHIFCEDKAWRVGYPHSTIMSVTPPMNYSDLLSLPLNTAQANELTTATNTMNLAMANFSGPQALETATGGMVFSLRAIGPNGTWTVNTPWGVLYKGQQPTVTQIRGAIKTACETSGVGSVDQWKSRFPDLYIIGRFYIIPFWDMIYKLNDSTIYKGIVKETAMLKKLDNLFPSMGIENIAAAVEYFTSPYDFIHLASIMDTGSLQNLGELNALHPTYRTVRADDPSFSYMDKSTQEFSTGIIKCLSIFSNAATDPLYTPYTENGLTYIPYSINEIEYAVISPDTYNSAQGVYQ